MTLYEIYAQYTPGTPGFCVAVETHCGYEISRSEIAQIADRAATPEEFEMIWNNCSWWQDQ